MEIKVIKEEKNKLIFEIQGEGHTLANALRKELWNDSKIKSFINEVLNLYRQILLEDVKTEIGNEKKLKRETVKDLNTMVNRLIQFKDKYYPPIQRSVNVNIDMTADKVLERIKTYKIINVKEEKEKEEEEEKK